MNFSLSPSFGQFPENTSAGKAFKKGWESFVKQLHQVDVFWDPVDQRWETYASQSYVFVPVGLPRVVPGEDYWGEKNMLEEVLEIGRSSRALDAKVIWSPRTGHWYHWANKTQPLPPPPPQPNWLVRLNADLDALDANTHLTPQERAEARKAIIAKAYGNR